jgi:hypothetical protein
MRSTLRSRSGEVVRNSNQWDSASNSTKRTQHDAASHFEQQTLYEVRYICVT